MSVNAAASRQYEQALIDIVRVLPPSRAEQLVDFARFLEAQILSDELVQEESAAEVDDDNARWDALLATDESQVLLDRMAAEALAEYRTGETQLMAFDDQGRITPK